MRSFIFCSFLIILLFACEKESIQSCPDQDVNVGFSQLLFVDENEPCSYRNFPSMTPGKGIVIQTAEMYDSLLVLIDLNDQICRKPEIDFEKYTILGLLTQASGCTRTYQRTIKQSADSTQFEVIVRECGGCEPLIMLWHWAVVPKLEAGAIVTFSTTTEKYNL